MKKLFPIILGILLGSAMMIAQVAYSQSNEPNPDADDATWWGEDAYAVGQVYDWHGISTSLADGKDLYMMVRGKLVVEPEQQALQTIAANYGMTVAEAAAFRDGSVAIVNNNRNFNANKNLSQEELLKFRSSFLEEYNNLKDNYDLQQEINTSATVTEIFINGNTDDSGFDLIDDLSRIEEILFLDKTESSVGGKWPNSLSSPYAVTSGSSSGPGAGENVAAPNGGQGSLTINPDDGQTATVDLGEGKVNADVLDEDVCSIENPLATAAQNFDLAKSREPKTDRSGGSDNGIPVSGADQTGGSPNGTAGPITDENGRVLPAKARVVNKVFCGPSTVEANSADFSAFASLGGASNGAGVQAGVAAAGFAVDVAVCVNIEAIKKTVSSYTPGDSCVQCEVEKINELMRKTLDNSLIPNKVTGNIMESAKCKSAFTALPDMKVIITPSPVPTPPNDDLLGKESIVDEWNQFVSRQLGYKSNNFNQDEAQEFAIKIVAPGGSQSSFYSQIENQNLNNAATVNANLEAFEITADANNIALFSGAIFQEMRQMTSFFQKFQAMFNDNIYNDACKAILTKPDIQ